MKKLSGERVINFPLLFENKKKNYLFRLYSSLIYTDNPKFLTSRNILYVPILSHSLNIVYFAIQVTLNVNIIVNNSDDYRKTLVDDEGRAPNKTHGYRHFERHCIEN